LVQARPSAERGNRRTRKARENPALSEAGFFVKFFGFKMFGVALESEGFS